MAAARVAGSQVFIFFVSVAFGFFRGAA